jgi:hypothetical protein
MRLYIALKKLYDPKKPISEKNDPNIAKDKMKSRATYFTNYCLNISSISGLEGLLSSSAAFAMNKCYQTEKNKHLFIRHGKNGVIYFYGENGKERARSQEPKDRAYRSNDTTELFPIVVLVLDVDYHEGDTKPLSDQQMHDKLKAMNINHIICRTSVPNNQYAYRIFIETLPIEQTAENLKAIYAVANEKLGINSDLAVTDKARMFFCYASSRPSLKSFYDGKVFEITSDEISKKQSELKTLPVKILSTQDDKPRKNFVAKDFSSLGDIKIYREPEVIRKNDWVDFSALKKSKAINDEDNIKKFLIEKMDAIFSESHAFSIRANDKNPSGHFKKVNDHFIFTDFGETQNGNDLLEFYSTHKGLSLSQAAKEICDYFWGRKWIGGEYDDNIEGLE